MTLIYGRRLASRRQRRPVGTCSQLIYERQHHWSPDEPALKGALPWKLGNTQPQEQREHALPRREEHDQAGQDKEGTEQIPADDERSAQHRICAAPRLNRLSRAAEVVWRNGEQKAAHNQYAGEKHHHE